jgi:RNA polymerase sigma-70 factor (ECF subfamily)
MSEMQDEAAAAIIGSEKTVVGPPSDETLAASASAGDEGAFELLFERHRRKVARVAGRFFNRPERIEEIVQDVFTKLYFALGDYSKVDGASFGAWVSRITVNACCDELRKLKRRPEATIGNVTDAELLWVKSQSAEPVPRNAESVAIARDLAEKLLARLSVDDRLVLTLLDGEENPVSEIAQLTGWSASKVKVRAHRARAALRKVVRELM